MNYKFKKADEKSYEYCMTGLTQDSGEAKLLIPENGRVEDVSDGYHSFKELYHHRMMLFASIVQIIVSDQIRASLTSTTTIWAGCKVWKSKHHSDGTMFPGMFIVGMIMPDGRQASYHYDLKDWDSFLCMELDRGPEFDGHTPDEAIQRIFDYVGEVCSKERIHKSTGIKII